MLGSQFVILTRFVDTNYDRNKRIFIWNFRTGTSGWIFTDIFNTVVLSTANKCVYFKWQEKRETR